MAWCSSGSSAGYTIAGLCRVNAAKVIASDLCAIPAFRLAGDTAADGIRHLTQGAYIRW